MTEKNPSPETGSIMLFKNKGSSLMKLINSFSSSNPIKSIANPIKNSPKDFRLFLLVKNKGIPIPIKGNE